MSSIVNIVASQNEQRKARGLRPKRFRRVPRQLFPAGAERQYRSRILALLDEAKAQIDALIRPLIPALGARSQRSDVVLPDEDPSSQPEADNNELAQFLALLIVARAAFKSQSQGKARFAALEVADRVSSVNRSAVEKQISSAVGTQVFAGPTPGGTTRSFIRENVRRVTTLPEEFFNDVEDIVNRGFRQGRGAEWMTDEIAKRFEITRNKAALIADDQTNKLNGQLTRARQTSLGITRYRWRTRRDDRVRPTHAAREGRIFSWDNPPSDGHPGEPIRCRCDAEPVLDEQA